MSDKLYINGTIKNNGFIHSIETIKLQKGDTILTITGKEYHELQAVMKHQRKRVVSDDEMTTQVFN